MATPKPRNVTLKDVAIKAGVSAMTVSRALSEKSHLVSPETARRCRELAAEMGYVPNLMARSLRGEQLQTIVMFAEFISRHHYLAKLVDIVSRSIEERRFGVISCQSLASFHKALRSFRLAGAVVIAPPEPFYNDPFGEEAIGAVHPPPTVLIHSASQQSDFNEVSPDIAAFSYHAACHLLELGHRDLAYLGGPRTEDEPNWFSLRRAGVTRAMGEYNVDPSRLLYQPCASADGGPASVQQLLKKAPGTTAIMCLNDEIAIAATVGAHRLGRRVPADLSIVGANDIELARFFLPPLTTLSIDIPGMVSTGLDLLFDEIQAAEPTQRAAGNGGPIKINIPASLIVRGSTAPPPTNHTP